MLLLVLPHYESNLQPTQLFDGTEFCALRKAFTSVWFHQGRYSKACANYGFLLAAEDKMSHPAYTAFHTVFLRKGFQQESMTNPLFANEAKMGNFFHFGEEVWGRFVTNSLAIGRMPQRAISLPHQWHNQVLTQHWKPRMWLPVWVPQWVYFWK